MSTLTDPPQTSADGQVGARSLLRRISRLELGAAIVAVLVMAGLALAEPDVLEAPFENARTMVFTFGGTAVAAAALVVMLWLRVPPAVRVLVLGVPFVAVSWWLLSPFFIDDVADDEFSTSIAEASAAPAPPPASDAADGTEGSGSPETTLATPTGPVLRGAGTFVGLAGHSGTGDAGFFEQPDGSHVLRLESFDIDNGPDLRLYVVPGADRTDPGDESLYLGALRGNIGDQTYELPTDFALTPGDWSVLVWCEAFSVEFVAATVTVA